MRRFLSLRKDRLPGSANTGDPVATEDAPVHLSLVMLVREPAQQVAAIAGLFLGVADEIIIAVDSRVEPASLGPLLDVATRVLRVEHTPPFANSAA